MLQMHTQLAAYINSIIIVAFIAPMPTRLVVNIVYLRQYRIENLFLHSSALLPIKNSRVI